MLPARKRTPRARSEFPISLRVYRVAAEATGFKSFAHDKLEVRVGEMVDLNIRMEVGNMTETVQVTAETPVLNTDSASLGQTIDHRRIQELPQRGGNPLELALLTPGVINATNFWNLRSARTWSEWNHE